MALSLKGVSASAGKPAATPNGNKLSVFQFGADHLYSKTVLTDYDPAAINLVKGTTQALYCVSGIDIEADEETTEAEFALTTTSTPEGENSAPLFLSAWSEIGAAQMSCELTMRRGVARIDLDARDADMDITDISVEDAPA